MEPKATKRGRKSVALDDESDTNSAAKKRGRKSTARVDSDEEEEESTRNKKTRKAEKASAKGRMISEETQPRLQDMAKYMDKENWEDLVDTVDTVERADEGLVVYFTLYVLRMRSPALYSDVAKRKNGEQIREKSAICRYRFPQKVRDLTDAAFHFVDNKHWTPSYFPSMRAT